MRVPNVREMHRLPVDYVLAKTASEAMPLAARDGSWLRGRLQHAADGAMQLKIAGTVYDLGQPRGILQTTPAGELVRIEGRVPDAPGQRVAYQADSALVLLPWKGSMSESMQARESFLRAAAK